MVAAGLPDWVADFINDLRELEKSGGASGPTPDIRNLLGCPPRTLEESIDAVLENR
jgi:hypothetical protein